MLRFSGSCQNSGSRVLDELQLSNGLLGKAGEETITTVHPAGSLSLRRHAHGPLAKLLMHMAHLSGNTSGVSKSSSYWLNYLTTVCLQKIFDLIFSCLTPRVKVCIHLVSKCNDFSFLLV